MTFVAAYIQTVIEDAVFELQPRVETVNLIKRRGLVIIQPPLGTLHLIRNRALLPLCQL